MITTENLSILLNNHIIKIQTFTKIDNSELCKSIDLFYEKNKDLNSEEFMQLFNNQYGHQIALIEKIYNAEQLSSIKGWIKFFGILTVISIIIGFFIYVM